MNRELKYKWTAADEADTKAHPPAYTDEEIASSMRTNKELHDNTQALLDSIRPQMLVLYKRNRFLLWNMQTNTFTVTQG